jgi:hypothetical protein
MELIKFKQNIPRAEQKTLKIPECAANHKSASFILLIELNFAN